MLVMMKDQGDNVTMAAADVTTRGKHGEHGDCGTCSWDQGTPKGNLRTSSNSPPDACVPVGQKGSLTSLQRSLTVNDSSLMVGSFGSL